MSIGEYRKLVENDKINFGYQQLYSLDMNSCKQQLEKLSKRWPTIQNYLVTPNRKDDSLTAAPLTVFRNENPSLKYIGHETYAENGGYKLSFLNIVEPTGDDKHVDRNIEILAKIMKTLE